MKRLLVSMLLVVSCTVLFSQTQEISIDSFKTTRSMFSLNAGLAADVSGGKGYSVFIKSTAYIGNRPFLLWVWFATWDFHKYKRELFRHRSSFWLYQRNR